MHASVRAALTIGTILVFASPAETEELRKQYWATSLSGAVHDTVLQGLYEAVTRGEVGWLDVDWQNGIPKMHRGINLILYHVGGNCYTGSDCDRFPSSEPTGDRWGKTERVIDLSDAAARKVVVGDLLKLARHADEIAPAGSIIGVHLDNVHKLDARGLADVFNEFLKNVKAAQDRDLFPRQGRSDTRRRIIPRPSERPWNGIGWTRHLSIRSTRTHDWTETECLTRNCGLPSRSENYAGSQSS